MKPESQPHIESNEADTVARPRRRWVHVLWMTVLLVVGVILAATNTRFGRDQVRQIAESQINALLQDARIEIGELDGNLLAGLKASDILLFRGGDEELVRLDAIQTSYQLLPLLRSRVHLDEVHLKGLHLQAAQKADSSWSWSNLLAPSEGESASEGAFQFASGTGPGGVVPRCASRRDYRHAIEPRPLLN